MLRTTRFRLNHYQTLGVAYRASPSEIKDAYHKMAKQLHPDQNPGDSQADAKFRQVKEAYEALSDRVRRAAYDRDWIRTGRIQWRAQAENGADGGTSSSDGLTQRQLVVLYAAVIGLPFAASLLRRDGRGDPRHATTGRARTNWTRGASIPEASPRDELVRAFFNPLSSRWERLGDMNDPPTPLDLFQFTVKNHPAQYRQVVQREISVPSSTDAFEVHLVPIRVTEQPLMMVDRTTGTAVY